MQDLTREASSEEHKRRADLKLRAQRTDDTLPVLSLVVRLQANQVQTMFVGVRVRDFRELARHQGEEGPKTQNREIFCSISKSARLVSEAPLFLRAPQGSSSTRFALGLPRPSRTPKVMDMMDETEIESVEQGFYGTRGRLWAGWTWQTSRSAKTGPVQPYLEELQLVWYVQG